MGLRIGVRIGLVGGEQNMGRLIDVRRPELSQVLLVIAPARRAIRGRLLDLAIDERADGCLFGGLTPAQWSCVALFLFGLVMVAKVRQIKKSGKDPQDLLLPPTTGPLPEDSAYRQSA